MTWEEAGGPVVREPTTRGFGTRGILAGIEAQLGGQVSFNWRAEGLICRLEVPVSERVPVHDRNEQYDRADETLQTAVR
jgi:two-component sensor histidine kinase